MRKSDKKVTWEGPIKIWEQEGGHAESFISVGYDMPVSEIELAFEDTFDRKDYASVFELPGRWRLTLELIE